MIGRRQQALFNMSQTDFQESFLKTGSRLYQKLFSLQLGLLLRLFPGLPGVQLSNPLLDILA